VTLYLFALLFGVLAGLRSMTTPAAVSWAAHLGHLDLGGSWLAFLGLAWVPWVLTVLAALELIADKLPSAPDRTVTHSFAWRLVSGGLCGAAVGVAMGGVVSALGTGVIGAFLGTMGGLRLRLALARAFGRDLPAALVEDAIAVGGAVLLVLALS